MAELVDTGPLPQQNADTRDLHRFGYRQELRRTLGGFSSFAAAFSYISPSTGIFTLFSLGLITLGGVFIWSWPIVAAGQFLVALNFAEVSSHFPVAGSVFQWTKYLAGRRYAWFTGWIYIFAGILTVTAVVVTLPLVLLPAFNLMGWSLNAGALHDQIWVAAITLVVITAINMSYFLGNIAVLWARVKNGWPEVDSPFKLGRWGMVVNVLALVYGGAMLVNFAWFGTSRSASNPKPNQTGGLLSLGWKYLNDIPILYTVLGFVLIIGALYYFIWERRKPLPVVVPPETGALVIPPESLPPEAVVGV